MAKAPAKKPPSKTEIYTSISESTGVPKKQVAAVFDAMQGEIKKAMSNRGSGVFAIPGLVKIEKKKVPAKPARKNVMVLGQLRDIPAKPASVKVKVRALKSLKDMVS
ncbi:MAG: HU family DNA-binding protein [Planctomycetota bacterium]